jgi:hypothetical protein
MAGHKLLARGGMALNSKSAGAYNCTTKIVFYSSAISFIGQNKA